MNQQSERKNNKINTQTVWQKIKLLLAGALIGGISYAMVSKYFL